MDRWYGSELLRNPRADLAIGQQVVLGWQVDETQLGQEPRRSDPDEPDEQTERREDGQDVAPLRERFSTRFNDMGFWAMLGAGVIPFPYKVITIMSGWTAMPLGTFIFTSILARGLRFFLVVAFLLWKFGAPIRDFIETCLALMFTLFVILLFGGFFALKYL